MKTTWRKKLGDVKLVHCTISDEELDREFNDGFGAPEGTPFTAWSQDHVYRSGEYDGHDYIVGLPRNPPS